MDERDERKRTSGDASKRFRRHQNWNCTTAPGRVWREPTYWPRGVRCIGGMTLIRALVRNLRTCPTMPREKAQAANLRGRKYRCLRAGADCSVIARTLTIVAKPLYYLSRLPNRFTNLPHGPF